MSETSKPTQKQSRKRKRKERTKDTDQPAAEKKRRTEPAVQPKGEDEAQEPADFAAFYLQKITQELSDDIEKIGSARDFTGKTARILIHALQQGASIFSEAEKAKIMRRTESSKGEDESKD